MEIINKKNKNIDKEEDIKNQIIKQKLDERNKLKNKNRTKYFKIDKDIWVISSILAASSILGFLGGLSAVNLNKGFTKNVSASQGKDIINGSGNDTSQSPNSGETSDYLSIDSIAERNMRSIAAINTESVKTDKSLKQFNSVGSGSGIVISSDGYIMTNNHVVSGAGKIIVTVNNESFEGSVVGVDSEFNVALLKIDKLDLQPVTFGDSSDVKIGEDVVVIGNPLGQLASTVTKGIISALDRDITINNETINLIQTDAPINPGSSGCGLFNLKGELIGMVLAKSRSATTEGIGFAISVNNLKKPLNDLERLGYIRGKVDIQMEVADAAMLKSSNLYKNYSKGVFITKVPEGSNAKVSGFQPGDCIISIDSQEINNVSELNAKVRNYSAGETVSVGIMRKDEHLTFSLQLAERSNRSQT